jgi:hypothetical protein
MVFSNIIGVPIKKKVTTTDFCQTAKVAMKKTDGGESRCVAHSEIALESHAEFILLGCPVCKAGPSRLKIWRPFKLIFFNFFFSVGQGWPTFLGGVSKIRII